MICCIDDDYSLYNKIYAQYGIITPVKREVYTIRCVDQHKSGIIGLRLHELINPKIPVYCPKTRLEILIEPFFRFDRFAYLDGRILLIENLIKMIGKEDDLKVRKIEEENDVTINYSFTLSTL